MRTTNKTHSSHPIKDYPRKYVTDRWIENFKKTGQGWLMITSNSMSPVIQPGDLVSVEKTTHSRICKGDIIVFWKENLLITHRVVRALRNQNENCFFERADRNPAHSLISSQTLLGKVVCIKRNGRIYDLNTLPWKMFNRLVGLTFYCSFHARTTIQKIRFFPESLKNIVKKTLNNIRLKRENILRKILKKK